MSGNYDMFLPCSLQPINLQNQIKCKLSSPIHRLTTTDEITNNASDQQYFQQWEECMNLQQDISQLQQQINNLQLTLQETELTNSKAVERVSQQNLQLAHWQRGYFTFMQYLVQTQQQIQQLTCQIHNQQAQKVKEVKTQQNSLETTIDKPKKTYRKVVPISKWDHSTDMSETLRNCHASTQKIRNPKYQTPRKPRQRSSIFNKKSPMLREKLNEEQISVPKIHVRMNIKTIKK